MVALVRPDTGATFRMQANSGLERGALALLFSAVAGGEEFACFMGLFHEAGCRGTAPPPRPRAPSQQDQPADDAAGVVSPAHGGPSGGSASVAGLQLTVTQCAMTTFLSCAPPGLPQEHHQTITEIDALWAQCKRLAAGVPSARRQSVVAARVAAVDGKPLSPAAPASSGTGVSSGTGTPPSRVRAESSASQVSARRASQSSAEGGGGLVTAGRAVPHVASPAPATQPPPAPAPAPAPAPPPAPAPAPPTVLPGDAYDDRPVLGVAKMSALRDAFGGSAKSSSAPIRSAAARRASSTTVYWPESPRGGQGARGAGAGSSPLAAAAAAAAAEVAGPAEPMPAPPPASAPADTSHSGNSSGGTGVPAGTPPRGGPPKVPLPSAAAMAAVASLTPGSRLSAAAAAAPSSSAPAPAPLRPGVPAVGKLLPLPPAPAAPAHSAPSAVSSALRAPAASFTCNAGFGVAVTRASVFTSSLRTHGLEVFSVTDLGGGAARVLGGFGKGEGQFKDPAKVCALPNGNLLVVDGDNARVQQLSPDGTCVRVYGVGSLLKPHGVATDGTVLAVSEANWKHHRVLLFDVATGDLCRAVGTKGSAPGQLDTPCGLAVDAVDKKLFVADSANGRVSVYRWPTGEPAGTLGAAARLRWPSDVAVLPHDRIAVADTRNHRVVILGRTTGEVLASFGKEGVGPGEFKAPAALCVGPDHRLFVLDSLHDRCQVFDAAL